MRQIAYVGEDGEISVCDLDSNHETPISRLSEPSAKADGERLANWPTWSPSGDRLAYFRYEIARGELAASAVFVVSPDGSNPVQVYQAPGETPIYMCWSPDGQRIALLVQAQDQLYLRVLDASSARPPITVAQGAPLYFAWQPDSRGLVVHVGLGQGGASASRVSWLRLAGGQVLQQSAEFTPDAAFRAPAWAHALGGATIAIDRENRTEIAVQSDAHAEPDILLSARLSPAFLWSSDGTMLACASRQPDGGTLYSGITLFRLAGRAVSELVDSPVLAFFWTPDNGRIVYVTGDMADRVVAVRSVDAMTRDVRDVGWVRPSRDLFMLFSHFDQYSQSQSLVSPDGQELVLAASRAKERENGSVPTVRQILVRSLSAEATEREVTRGRLACWRPT